MKHLYIIFLALLACCPEVIHAENEISYLAEIGIQNRGVVKKGREVQLTMLVDLSELKIKTQHTIALTPILLSKDGNREAAFPPIVIDGKARNKMYLRAQRLESVDIPPYHDENAQVVIRRRNGKDQGYEYLATVPYEHWMLDGRIELREQVYGCVNCSEGKAEQVLPGNILPAFIPDYRICTIVPEPEPVKVRAETRTARLQFRQDSYRILPGYKDNRSDLDTVSHSIQLVEDNEDVSITGIFITGYASPEGTVAHNLKLSENRAKALADYICRHDKFDPAMIHVDWKGEDWEGFRLVLDKFPGLVKRGEVVRIIDECTGDRDVCEKQLQELVPADIYHRLLNEIYPLLRRNEYKIEYNVRNFNLDEARRMVDERPDLLSLTEMYKVADSYEKGSPGYGKVMQVAARYFPDAPAVLNDLALEAMAKKEYDKAVQLLEYSKVTFSDSTLLNTLGVAYAGAGEPYKAEDAFRRAAEAGVEEARHNLTQVQGVIEQL